MEVAEGQRCVNQDRRGTGNGFFKEAKDGEKNPPAMPEAWVQSLGWEDPLEEGMAIHSSILAWRIPMDRGAWWALVHVVAKSQTH